MYPTSRRRRTYSRYWNAGVIWGEESAPNVEPYGVVTVEEPWKLETVSGSSRASAGLAVVPIMLARFMAVAMAAMSADPGTVLIRFSCWVPWRRGGRRPIAGPPCPWRGDRTPTPTASCYLGVGRSGMTRPNSLKVTALMAAEFSTRATSFSPFLPQIP